MRLIPIIPVLLAVIGIAVSAHGTATGVGSWSAAASMAAARGGHTAMLLPDGHVLVMGGYNGAALAAAELYDEPSNTWTPTGSMATPRYNHTATLLPNGKVLVTGGQNDGPSPIASAELYDPITQAWTSAENMSIGRFSHSATLLPNGKVLIAGGYNIASAELYDPASNSWSPAASMATQRRLHTATLLSDGTVLVAGGVNCLPCVPLGGAEVYHPELDSWSSVNDLATMRYQQSASLLPNGSVLVAGGWNGSSSYTSTEVYSPATHEWIAGPAMVTNRVSHTATTLADDTILVTGGGGGFGQAFEQVATAEIFDPALMLWSSAGTMSQGRTNNTAIRLLNNRVLVAGGGTLANGYTNTAEIFTPPQPPATPTPTATPCPDQDCDGIPDGADNCVSDSNADQLNSDANFIDNSPPYAPGVDDRTLVHSDSAGDACDPDDDNDGLSDGIEGATPCGAASGPTNSKLLDTDGDRYADGPECVLGSDPLMAGSIPPFVSCGAAGDSDGDRLSDRVEVCRYNSDPESFDTDGDGTGDGCEAASINADLVVNSGDQLLMVLEIIRVPTPSLRLVNFDVNKDGAVNAGDQLLLAGFISPSGQCP